VAVPASAAIGVATRATIAVTSAVDLVTERIDVQDVQTDAATTLAAVAALRQTSKILLGKSRPGLPRVNHRIGGIADSASHTLPRFTVTGNQ
jgi:hypothetical protein